MVALGGLAPDTLEKWRKGLPSELAFWHEFLTAPEYQWHREKRLSPDFLFPYFAIQLLGSSAPKEIKALDVGSGPASTIGCAWPNHVVHLTRVDPLADGFNKLLADCGFKNAPKIVQGSAEKLLDIFERDSFDFVYCGNALDHTYAPLIAIQNMMHVLKPGGWLVLICFENEGENEAYAGLHQWNFCIRNRRLVLWNRKSEVDVFASIEGCERHRVAPLEAIEGDKRKRLMASIRRPRT